MAVPVSVILVRKGADVHTIHPAATVREAARLLADHRIGALVVCDEGPGVTGIVSERDLVAALAQDGAAALERTVAEVMTEMVISCHRQTTIDELMATMTDQRIRHVPVLEDGKLVGIVSIGDIVKTRLDELEVQAETLERYVTGSHS